MIVVYAYLVMLAADAVLLAGLARPLRLPGSRVAAMVLAHVAGGVLFGAGVVAWLFNGYGEEYGDHADTLAFAIPLILAGVALACAGWLPVLRGRLRRNS